MKLSLFNLTCIIFEGKIIYLIIKILMFSIHVMISKDFYHILLEKINTRAVLIGLIIYFYQILLSVGQ